jgi:hypothetical protein
MEEADGNPNTLYRSVVNEISHNNHESNEARVEELKDEERQSRLKEEDWERR